jgi:hypothetical protein
LPIPPTEPDYFRKPVKNDFETSRGQSHAGRRCRIVSKTVFATPEKKPGVSSTREIESVIAKPVAATIQFSLCEPPR